MFDIAEFVQECKSICEQPNPAERMASYLRSALQEPSDVAAAFDSGISQRTPLKDRYLSRSPQLLILRVALDPRFVAPVPHDHRIWAFVGIYQGFEENTLFERRGDSIQQTEKILLEPGNVLALDPTMIHSIANPSEMKTIGIHVYLGDLVTQERSMWSPQTLVEERFEIGRFVEYQNQLVNARTAGAIDAGTH